MMMARRRVCLLAWMGMARLCRSRRSAAGIEQRVDVSLPVAEAVAESVTVTASADSAGALQDVSRYVQSLPAELMLRNHV